MLPGLFDSIAKNFKYIFKIYIVLNDDEKYLRELQDIIFSYDLECQIIVGLPELIHKNHLHPCYGYRHTDNGWVTQQIATLISSRLIDTTYFVHICSKDRFVREFGYTKIIVNNKCRVLREDWMFVDDPVKIKTFEQWGRNACVFWQIDFDLAKDKMIKNLTPIVNNTKLMQMMVNEIYDQGHDLADLIGFNHDDVYPGRNKTTEYALYAAWLTKNSYADDFIEFYDFPNDIYETIRAPYELRRK
jgi:hypothetical protein